MGGHLLMSEGERLRKVILEGVRDGRVTLKIAALRLGVTYRQLRRIWKRFQDEGDPGLIHRGRGRPSNRSKPISLRHRAIQRYQERYEGFGPTLACEKLAQEGMVLDHETLRRWLIEERLWAGPKARTRHRAYRERKARFGEMLQLDGSQHRWFGRHEPEACLMNMVDGGSGGGRTPVLLRESLQEVGDRDPHRTLAPSQGKGRAQARRLPGPIPQGVDASEHHHHRRSQRPPPGRLRGGPQSPLRRPSRGSRRCTSPPREGREPGGNPLPGEEPDGEQRLHRSV